jgi:paired amphipathic helix protein Sin3a
MPTEGSFEELDFFNRVKGALDNPKLYHEFLKCLNLYSQEIISRVELVLLVKDLLSR